jgi:hypothetical protein
MLERVRNILYVTRRENINKKLYDAKAFTLNADTSFVFPTFTLNSDTFLC